MGRWKRVGQAVVIAYVIVGAVCYNCWNPVLGSSNITHHFVIQDGFNGVGPFLKSLFWPYFLFFG